MAWLLSILLFQLVVGVISQVNYVWEFDGDILAKSFSTVVERERCSACYGANDQQLGHNTNGFKGLKAL